MTRRNFVLGISAAAFFTACSWAATAQDIQERTIRFGHTTNPGHPIALGAKKFGEIITAKSGGKLKFRDFPSSQLGSEAQQQSALLGGTQEIMAQGSAQVAGLVKEFGLLDFPFIVSTEQQADALHDGPAGQALMNLLPAKGLVALGYWENGFRHVTNSKRPIATIEDLNGLKIRVQPSPIFIEMFQALKTNPVPMSFSELYTALETRTVDAQENPLLNIVASKLYEVQKYASLTGHVYGNVIILVSKRFWDRLSSHEKKILQDAFVEARDYEREESRRQTREAVAELTAKGMQVNEVTPAEKERMRELTRPIAGKFAAQYDPAVVQVFQAELERIRKP